MAKTLVILPIIAMVAGMLLLSTVMVGMAQADQPKRDAKKDSPLKDFDLKRYGFKKNGDAYVAVYGRAGQTLPAGEHTAYASR